MSGAAGELASGVLFGFLGALLPMAVCGVLAGGLALLAERLTGRLDTGTGRRGLPPAVWGAVCAAYLLPLDRLLRRLARLGPGGMGGSLGRLPVGGAAAHGAGTAPLGEF